MEDANALLEPLLAHGDELVGGTLEPGGHHAPVVMPDAAEAIPIAGIAPYNPVFQQIAYVVAILLSRSQRLFLSCL